MPAAVWRSRSHSDRRLIVAWAVLSAAATPLCAAAAALSVVPARLNQTCAWGDDQALYAQVQRAFTLSSLYSSAQPVQVLLPPCQMASIMKFIAKTYADTYGVNASFSTWSQIPAKTTDALGYYYEGFGPQSYAARLWTLTEHPLVALDTLTLHQRPVAAYAQGDLASAAALENLTVLPQQFQPSDVKLAPMALMYNLAMMTRNNLSVPNTWEELITLADRVNNTDLNGDGLPDGAFCMDIGSGCKASALLATVYASMAQTEGKQQGIWFNRSTFQPLFPNPALAQALRLMRQLSKYGSTPTCDIINKQFRTGRCLMTMEWSPAFFFLALHDDIAIKGQMGFADVPAATSVWAHQDSSVQYDPSVPGSGLTPCNSTVCPRGKQVTRSDGTGVQMVNRVTLSSPMIFAQPSVSRNNSAELLGIAAVFIARVGSAYTIRLINGISATLNPATNLSTIQGLGMDTNDFQQRFRPWMLQAAAMNASDAIGINLPFNGLYRLAFGSMNLKAMQSTDQDIAAIMQEGLRNFSFIQKVFPMNHTQLLFYNATLGVTLTTSDPDNRVQSSNVELGRILPAILVPTVAVLLIVGLLTLLHTRTKHGYRALLGKARPPGTGAATTIVVTDIQSSTMLWEALPAEVMDQAIRQHHRCVRTAMAAHDGYESATEGDSFILAFWSAHQASAFAMEVQNALMDVEWPQELLAHPEANVVTAQTAAPNHKAQELSTSEFMQTGSGGSNLLTAIAQRSFLGIIMRDSSESSVTLSRRASRPVPKDKDCNDGDEPSAGQSMPLSLAGRSLRNGNSMSNRTIPAKAALSLQLSTMDHHMRTSSPPPEAARGDEYALHQASGAASPNHSAPDSPRQEAAIDADATTVPTTTPRCHSHTLRRPASVSRIDLDTQLSAGLAAITPQGVPAALLCNSNGTAPPDAAQQTNNEDAFRLRALMQMPAFQTAMAGLLTRVMGGTPGSGQSTRAGVQAGIVHELSDASQEMSEFMPVDESHQMLVLGLGWSWLNIVKAVHQEVPAAQTGVASTHGGRRLLTSPRGTSKPTASLFSANTVTVCKGLRVRIGLHSGVSSAEELLFDKATQRMHYTGTPIMIAKRVADAAQGGMVLMSATTFSRLSHSKAKPSRAAAAAEANTVVMYAGRHELGLPALNVCQAGHAGFFGIEAAADSSIAKETWLGSFCRRVLGIQAKAGSPSISIPCRNCGAPVLLPPLSDMTAAAARARRSSTGGFPGEGRATASRVTPGKAPGAVAEATAPATTSEDDRIAPLPAPHMSRPINSHKKALLKRAGSSTNLRKQLSNKAIMRQVSSGQLHAFPPAPLEDAMALPALCEEQQVRTSLKRSTEGGRQAAQQDLPGHDLYIAIPVALFARLGHLGPVRSKWEVLQGTLSAPMPAASIVFMHAYGASMLLAELPGPARLALSIFRTCVLQQLSLAGGYLVETADGFVLAAFPHPASSITWALACADELNRQAWPEEILEHELGSEVVQLAPRMPAHTPGSGRSVRSSMNGTALAAELQHSPEPAAATREQDSAAKNTDGCSLELSATPATDAFGSDGAKGQAQRMAEPSGVGIRFSNPRHSAFGSVWTANEGVSDVVVVRGLRMRVGIDVGTINPELHPTTGRMVYRGRVMNRAARIAAKAASGQVLASATAWQLAQDNETVHNAGVCARELGAFELKGLAEPLELVSCMRPHHCNLHCSNVLF